MLRKLIATWAVLQFLGVWIGVTLYCLHDKTLGSDAPGIMTLLFYGVCLVEGSLAAAFSLLVLGMIGGCLFGIWHIIFGREERNPGAGHSLTLGDIAGIASAFHPRTGALLNVAANIDARTQALTVTPPAGPAHNPVDDERL